MQQTPALQTPPLHAVPSLSELTAHFPAVQVVAAQVLVVLHTEQEPPPVPQELMEVPVLHVVPVQQPVQHLPLLQVPPVQAVPTVAGLVAQAPPLQLSSRQGVPLSHLLHIEPGVPQAPVAVPVWQVVPSQQPVQHFPPKQAPPVQAVPSVALATPQMPLEQEAVSQELVVGHTWHVTPLAPHELGNEPVSQTVPLQQPVQSVVAQVPPHPSSAPKHFPLHEGTQTH